MGDQFKGLPMGDLIGGPLMAACDAQVKLARATSDFIKVVGFKPTPAQLAGTDKPCGELWDVGDVQTAKFRFSRPSAVPDATTGQTTQEDVCIEVPLLSIVKIPSLGIKTVDVSFDMEVKNSETSKESFDAQAKMEAEASVGYGPFSLKVNISGSVSSHKENTRSTDQSAKYHVEVHAEDSGMPEGLARVLDIMNSAVAPKSVTPSKALPDAEKKQAA
jgi:hypothetical protein